MTVRSKKIFRIAAGMTALAVVAVILGLLLNIQTFKPRIEAAASKALGMEVRIKGRLGLALLPGIGITLKELSVSDQGADVVTVEQMKIGLKLIPLARREVRLSRVGLIKPVFFIARAKSGLFPFQKTGRRQPGKALAVERISISRGKLVYTDGPGRRIELDDFDVTIRNLSYGGTDGAEPFRDSSFDGDVGCRSITINNTTMTNLALKTSGRNGILEINPVTVNIFGGTGKGTIHLDATRASPRCRVLGALKGIRIEELIGALSSGNLPGKHMEGTINVSADLTAAGKSMAEVKSSLDGDFSLNGKDLLLSGIDIDALISKYEKSQNFNLVDVGAYFLAGPFGPVLTKSYNFGSLYEETRGGNGIIRELVSVWTVTAGIAGAVDVALATKTYRIAMKGGLDFNSDRFDDVTIAVLDKQGCAVYSQKVHGPFRKAKIDKISILKSLTGSVSNALKDAWKLIGGECAVFYSGSVAQPEG